MSDPSATNPKRPRLAEEPGLVDGIPVEELVRITREFTARITNEDRQRLTIEVNESGRTIHSGAPFILQQFFTGKIDLDQELSRRFPSAPLLPSTNFNPAPGKRGRRGVAQFKAQDESASLLVEVQGMDGAMEATFLLGGMIGLRFTLGAVAEQQRKRFLELMRRPSGIAILWTRERWERDYFIFVVRDRFARVYAFGPGRFDAACRLPPDPVEQFVEWLSGFWDTETAGSLPEPKANPSW